MLDIRIRDMPGDQLDHFTQLVIEGLMELSELPVRIRDKVSERVKEKEKEDVKVQAASRKVQAKPKAKATRKKRTTKTK